MTDKERILMAIITRIIPGMKYRIHSEPDDYIESLMLSPEKLTHGDLVFANTSICPNDFMVGFVESVQSECVVIREIGSSRLCNYYNETFTRINKDRLGYEVLEGLQYKIYNKVLKAFEYTEYFTRFKSISFEDNTCTVKARESFKNETIFEVSFEYNSKTSIKSIGKLLEDKEKTASK
ncbi:MAG: hypothetical protein K0R00_3178 [Herbinix sp.]|nr:hypothetical protein [Herbinix sp.]